MLFSKEIFFIAVNLAFFPTTFSQLYPPTSINIKEVPFIAALYSNNNVFCVGTIFNENYIITAADCIKNLTAAEIIIKVGQQNDGQGQSFKAKNVTIAIEDEIDRIAVIELENPLIYNENISNIDTISSNVENQGAYIVGWTCCSTSRWRLQKANIELLPSHVCRNESRKYLSYVDSYYFNATTHFCFSGMKYGYAWRYYGSPLIINGKLAGIKILNKNDNSLYVDIRHFDYFLKKLEGPAFPTTTTTTVTKPSRGVEEILADILNILKIILDCISKKNEASDSSEEQLLELLDDTTNSNLYRDYWYQESPTFEISCTVEHTLGDEYENPAWKGVWEIRYLGNPALKLSVTSRVDTSDGYQEQLITEYSLWIFEEEIGGSFEVFVKKIKQVLALFGLNVNLVDPLPNFSNIWGKVKTSKATRSDLLDPRLRKPFSYSITSNEMPYEKPTHQINPLVEITINIYTTNKIPENARVLMSGLNLSYTLEYEDNITIPDEEIEK